MLNLVKTIQNNIFQHNLFKKNDKIVLAISGGPDSIAMLDIFSKLQKKYSLELLIAHVNYNLRGKDSQKDEELVQKLADKYKLKIEILKNIEIKKASENELRDIRYNFFEKVRKENKFDFIAVAHNKNDQIETFLMRIIRGAGLSGLTAMKFKNNFIIRPLLTTSRKEILTYIQKNKLIFRLDKTNLENNYLRNKIRNQLIPSLEKNFNPKLSQTISENLISISEDYDYISKIAQKEFRKFETLSIKRLSTLHPAILRRVILQSIATNKGDLKNIKTANIEEILKIIYSTKNKIQLIKFKNLKITRRGDKLLIEKI